MKPGRLQQPPSPLAEGATHVAIAIAMVFAVACGSDGQVDATDAGADGTTQEDSTDLGDLADAATAPVGVFYLFGVDRARNAWTVTMVDPTSDDLVVREFEVPELAALSAPVSQGGNGRGPGWGDAIVSQDQSRVFVVATNVARVAVFETDTNTLETILRVGGRPLHAYAPQEGEIWVHADEDGAFDVIDERNLTVSDPVAASADGSGHGKMMWAEELGQRYYASNTNDPGIFPIDGSTRTPGDMIPVCSAPCEDDPETDEDESTSQCGATHDIAYNPTTNRIIVECTEENGYAFVDADDESVAADLVDLAGDIAHSPGYEYMLVIDGRREEGQIGIWDVSAPEHDGVAFDRVVDFGGAPSPDGTGFRQNEQGDWEAWVPQSSGSFAAVIALSRSASKHGDGEDDGEFGDLELIDIGQPAVGAGGNRVGALGGDWYMTSSDEGIVLVSAPSHEVVHGPTLDAVVRAIAWVER